MCVLRTRARIASYILCVWACSFAALPALMLQNNAVCSRGTKKHGLTFEMHASSPQTQGAGSAQMVALHRRVRELEELLRTATARNARLESILEKFGTPAAHHCLAKLNSSPGAGRQAGAAGASMEVTGNSGVVHKDGAAGSGAHEWYSQARADVADEYQRKALQKAVVSPPLTPASRV